MSSGALAGFERPDYGGGSVAELLASLIRARGGRSPHPDLRGLPASSLADASSLLLLVVDGLGLAQLHERVAGEQVPAFFSQHQPLPITTVCPATTAGALTTLASGATPTEHGVLGWFLNLPDLGLVSALLPGTTRTDVPFTTPDFDLRAYLRIPSHLDTTRGPRELLTFGDLLHGRYSMAGTRWTARHGFRTLAGMTRQLAAFARRGEGVAFAYWPGYDARCHQLGVHHPGTVAHLSEIDRALGRLLPRLRGTGCVLLVVADHGLVDAGPGETIDLAAVPGLYDCLATLPAGDPRLVHCFVRPHQLERFDALVDRHLGHACACAPGEALLDAGLFGPGPPHPALHTRVGDRVLIARGSHALESSVWGHPAPPMVAHHGGLSPREVQVPLLIVRP